MEVNLSFVEPLLSDFKTFYIANKSDIDDSFTSWKRDELMKGVSIEHYRILDLIVNFMYNEVQMIEAIFGSIWDKDTIIHSYIDINISTDQGTDVNQTVVINLNISTDKILL